MEPTEPRRPRGLLGLGTILAVGAVNKAVRRVTDERPEAEPPPAPTPGHGALTRWLALGLALVLIAVGVGVVVVRRGDDGNPSHWDPRIADLARFVEKHRGLRYDHPVRAEFLSDKAFRARVTNDDELSAEDEASIHHYEGLFRALGLVEGKVDLRASENQLAGEGVIGLYVPEEDRIYI